MVDYTMMYIVMKYTRKKEKKTSCNSEPDNRSYLVKLITYSIYDFYLTNCSY